VIEKSFKTRLVQFFDKHNILFENQFGFRKNHSTNQALLNVVTQCLVNANAKKHSCLILLDIHKAFDTVNHEILMTKLNHYGISEQTLIIYYKAICLIDFNIFAWTINILICHALI